MKTLTENRKVKFAYDIQETLEAGIQLLGPEVKSALCGGMVLQGAWVEITQGEAWLKGAHIEPGWDSKFTPTEPLRPRKLLLHKHEILKIQKHIMLRGQTCVAIKVIYTDPPRAKVKILIGLGVGRKAQDKRQYIKDRESKRDLRNG